ncbi:MAG TPA: hypothetical protein VJM11_07390 [Nevskiaceae bacterium]|nr:hypothetical protein [Nevskiaceae bacterium]
MLRSMLTLALLASAHASFAQETPDGWFLSGNKSAAYAVAPGTGGSGKSAVLRSVTDPEGGAGLLIQASRAGFYAGRRARLTARVKTQDAAGWAGLILRAEDKNGTIVALDNMNTRPIKGTTDWQTATVILDIPASATTLVYGLSLTGTGTAWLDDVKLDPVGPEIEVTWAVSYEMPKRPLDAELIRPAPDNLSLEAWSVARAAAAPVTTEPAGPGFTTRAVNPGSTTQKPRALD